MPRAIDLQILDQILARSAVGHLRVCALFGRSFDQSQLCFAHNQGPNHHRFGTGSNEKGRQPRGQIGTRW